MLVQVETVVIHSAKKLPPRPEMRGWTENNFKKDELWLTIFFPLICVNLNLMIKK